MAASAQLWMNRKILPDLGDPRQGWTVGVRAMARGRHASLDAWAKHQGWTAKAAVSALGLASACRLSFDPAGNLLALGSRSNPTSPWPRLEALLAAGPLRGSLVLGAYWGMGNEAFFSHDLVEQVAERFDQGSLPAPFNDRAWAAQVKNAASRIEWTHANGERLASLFELCATIHEGSALDTEEIHDPALPCGDAMAWLLACVPDAGLAYFSARSADQAAFPPLGKHGEALMALAGALHGWEPELFVSRRAKGERGRPLGILLADSYREIGLAMDHRDNPTTEKLRRECKRATDLGQRRPALAAAVFRHAIGSAESAHALSMAATLSSGSLWRLAAAAAPELGQKEVEIGLRMLGSLTGAACASSSHEGPLGDWRAGLAKLSLRAVELCDKGKGKGLRGLLAGLAVAMGPSALTQGDGKGERDKRFSQALGDLGRAVVGMGGSCALLWPVARLGPACAMAFSEAEAADIAASANHAPDCSARKNLRL